MVSPDVVSVIYIWHCVDIIVCLLFRLSEHWMVLRKVIWCRDVDVFGNYT